MTVYVDDARRPYGRMKMCHMLADTEAELHAMAEALNIPRRHYHDLHYNVCLSKRARAIELGAMTVTQRQMVAIRRAVRFDAETVARSRRVSLLRLFDPSPAPIPPQGKNTITGHGYSTAEPPRAEMWGGLIDRDLHGGSVA